MNEDLNKWFKEKWVNIGKKVDGKHPPCGTSGEKRGYAKCVPAAKAAGMSKKEKESATQRKRAAQNDAGRGGKDSSGQGKKPIYVSTKPKNETMNIEERLNLFLEKNCPTDPGKWSASKSAAKSKFDVYPSAYANGWAAKNYKSKGGSWKTCSENVVNEVTGREAKEIAKLTGTRDSIVQKFIDDFNLNAKNLFNFIAKGKEKVRKDFATAMSGRPGNKYQGDFVGMFGESIVNEACWDGYKQVGGKMKNGKMVPNCVPVSEDIDSDDDVTTFDSNIIRRKAITATAGQTVFTADLPFIDGFEQIFMNGLLLVKTTDYATSGGNTVTLTSGAAASDIIEIVSVTGANSIETYTQAETNALLAANTSVAPLSISANTTLVAKKRYFVTSASALTLTLPASPALNDEIQILDASGNSSTYNITVARNANKINGGNNNLIIDTNGGWYTLLYTGSTYGWKVG